MHAMLVSIQKRWPYAPVAVVYVVALALVANFAFGAAFLTSTPFARPARTSAYGNGLTSAAPVDVQRIAQAVSEANGGPPTIGRPLPLATKPVAVTSTVTSPPAAVAISRSTTPTYPAVTTVSSLSIASLYALIPTNLTFPTRANTHKRR